MLTGYMRRLSTFLFTLIVAAAGAACSSVPTTPVEATLTLAPGETGAAGTLAVKFIGVTIDTRCPGDAFCIQMGDAFVALEASVATTRRAFELQLLNPMNQATEIRGYEIGIESLSPYPFASLPPIRHEDYRVTLKIQRR